MCEDDCMAAEVADTGQVNEINGADEQTDCFNYGGCDNEALSPPLQSQQQVVAICKRLCDTSTILYDAPCLHFKRKYDFEDFQLCNRLH